MSETWKFLSLAVFVSARKWQAMPVLIHSARRGKNPAVISPPLCLPGAAPPNPFELPASGQAVTFGERKKLLRYGVAMQETLHCNEQEVKPHGKLYFRSPYRVRMCMITKRSMIKTDMSHCLIIRFRFTTILFWMVAGCCTVTFTAHANMICCAKHRQGLLHCKGTCSR